MNRSYGLFAIFIVVHTSLFASQASYFCSECGIAEPFHRAATPTQEAFDALLQGDRYFYGLGTTEKDLDKAELLYDRAAAKGGLAEVRNLAKQRLAELALERQIVQQVEKKSKK